MTNVSEERAQRKQVITDREFSRMIQKTREEQNRPNYPFYYGFRDRAILCIFRLTGKRVSEVSRLEVGDLEIEDESLSITFTVSKKRKGQKLLLRRTKQVPLDNPLTEPIIEYWKWMKENLPSIKWLLPRTHYSPYFDTLSFDDKPLSTRQILRIVQKYNPNVWCHLFRETAAADIIEKDQSIIAPWKVRRRLDLEKVETAFRYMDRYAKDVIKEVEVDKI